MTYLLSLISITGVHNIYNKKDVIRKAKNARRNRSVVEMTYVTMKGLGMVLKVLFYIIPDASCYD